MSLSIEMRVNGHPVATLVAHNTTGAERSLYDGQGVLFDQHGEPRTFTLVDIAHTRSEGIVKLSAILLREAAKVLNIK